MDKKCYYRLLGLQEGADRKKIDAAYEKRIRMLQSADYADDPEYAHKRMVQTKNAYKVLTGAAAPAAVTQRKDHFERIKDALDGGEDTVKAEKRRLHRQHIIDDSPIGGLKSLGHKVSSTAKTVTSKRSEMSDDDLKKVISAIGAVVVLISGIVSSCDINDSSDYQWEDEGLYIEEPYVNENFDDPYSSRMAAMYNFSHEFDYYGGLDYSTVEEYSNLVRWESYDEENAEEQLYEMADILDAPQDGYREMLVEFTGDGYYLDGAELEECIDQAADCIGAPYFGDVAGATEPYYNMPIVTYADYLTYLNNVIKEQGPDIWGEEL